MLAPAAATPAPTTATPVLRIPVRASAPATAVPAAPAPSVGESAPAATTAVAATFGPSTTAPVAAPPAIPASTDVTAPPASFADGTDGLEDDWTALDCMSYLFAPDRPEEAAAATQQPTGPRMPQPSGGTAAGHEAADAGRILGSSAASSRAVEGLVAGTVTPEVSVPTAAAAASGGVEAAAGGPMQRGSGSGPGAGGGGLEGWCCLVCLDAPREHGFLHGGSMHIGVCGGCAARLAAEKRRRGSRLLCPVCREPVERMVALFA
ncbi:hypothetical protein TSOC_011333 [Tetrabaena socialis]|uniref:RING-type domain-containing protein n=1 Tax=Tetrabaena socialis TaxID=47790 RepID=A0A2J7ZQZ0_9CHLO|nr:hypothetical protein TSOC_011333 [Tetrabaena socialis]|eukprot:PNH02666.1 hypothetical protein TSOC_011333 [Tetrabaena socialis]